MSVRWVRGAGCRTGELGPGTGGLGRRGNSELVKKGTMSAARLTRIRRHRQIKYRGKGAGWGVKGRGVRDKGLRKRLGMRIDILQSQMRRATGANPTRYYPHLPA